MPRGCRHPLAAFFLPRAIDRLPLAACLLSWPSIPLCVGSFLPCHLVTWSLVTGHFRFNTRQPGTPPRTSNVPPRYLHSTPRDDTPCPTPLHPARIPLMCRPCAPPRPRDLMVRYSRFPICHTNFGIRNSEFQNRESGKAELWCGRVGQNNLSCSKRSHPRSGPYTPSSNQTRS